LDSIAGQLTVPKDQAGGGIDTCEVQVDEHGERVVISISRSLHVSRLVHGSASESRCLDAALSGYGVPLG
jgi:hypothetical protein